MACRDLYDSGVKDDKLALLYNVGKSSKVAVKTSLGLTDSFKLNDNVLQVDVFGNILASNQINKFGKHCLKNTTHIYIYRNKIPIVPLTMLVIRECGYQTELIASYISSQSIFNYLQFGLSKYSKMHIGKTRKKFKCTPVLLDSLTSEEKEDNKQEKLI